MSKDELTTALGADKVVESEERQQIIGCSYIDGLSELPLSSPLPGEVIGVEGPQKEQVLIFAPDLFIPSLEEVTTKLKATDCSSLSPLPLSHLMKGQPCAAIFSEDSTLYRAMVSSTPFKDQVEVSFVDYGNSEVKAIDEVLTLPAELLSIAHSSGHSGSAIVPATGSRGRRGGGRAPWQRRAGVNRDPRPRDGGQSVQGGKGAAS